MLKGIVFSHSFWPRALYSPGEELSQLASLASAGPLITSLKMLPSISLQEPQMAHVCSPDGPSGSAQCIPADRTRSSVAQQMALAGAAELPPPCIIPATITADRSFPFWLPILVGGKMRCCILGGDIYFFWGAGSLPCDCIRMVHSLRFFLNVGSFTFRQLAVLVHDCPSSPLVGYLTQSLALTTLFGTSTGKLAHSSYPFEKKEKIYPYVSCR